MRERTYIIHFHITMVNNEHKTNIVFDKIQKIYRVVKNILIQMSSIIVFDFIDIKKMGYNVTG